MAEELKQGIQAEDKAAQTFPLPEESKQVTVADMDSVTDPSYRVMLSDTVDGYVNSILKTSELTRTHENVNKVIMNLATKINQWISAGDFALDDLDEGKFTNEFFEDATRRRGMDNKTDNWKKIISLLLENN